MNVKRRHLVSLLKTLIRSFWMGDDLSPGVEAEDARFLGVER